MTPATVRKSLKGLLCTGEEREGELNGGPIEQRLQQSLTKDREVSMRIKQLWPEPLTTVCDSPLDRC